MGCDSVPVPVVKDEDPAKLLGPPPQSAQTGHCFYVAESHIKTFHKAPTFCLRISTSIKRFVRSFLAQERPFSMSNSAALSPPVMPAAGAW